VAVKAAVVDLAVTVAVKEDVAAVAKVVHVVMVVGVEMSLQKPNTMKRTSRSLVSHV
jgi:hypothetical protein